MTISKTLGARLLCGAAAVAILVGAGAARAEEQAIRFEIPAQPLTSALNEFGIQSGSAVLFKADVTGTKLSRPLSGAAEPEMALAAMLDGTGLSYRREGDAFVIVQGGSAAPQSGSAAGDGAEGTVEALIVTAQKKEEAIQDVPIAISAFTQKSLEEQKIEGGFDLLKAIPNVTFSKNNFTSYNFSIRGIGTKAVSATTDPGVSVAFNSTGLIVNRLFEQEYFDIERVEVLRGPQGTLYGRNATAGVINVISAKPDMNEFSGSIKGEVGNYDAKRMVAMINVPLAEDTLAVRLAGSLTSREGYDFNTGTGHAVNGRDLWSARLTVGFNPTERIRSNLIWERFEEDDDRSRTGKQLCHHDDGRLQIGDFRTDINPNQSPRLLLIAAFSQGCKPGSLYDDAAFGTPNGLSLPFYFGAAALSSLFPIGFTDPAGQNPTAIVRIADPYGGLMQSRDLRVINSFRDPVYRAKADILELNIDIELSDQLTLVSQTAYNKDSVYSFQDFNRFNTLPAFVDTSSLYEGDGSPAFFRPLAPGGIFCDPQLGCSDTIAGFDISQGWARQFSQELRLQSDFDGPLNFSVGANYTRFQAEIDYYVFFNMITVLSMTPILGLTNDYTKCGIVESFSPYTVGLYDWSDPVCSSSIYIDPNPVESVAGDGHNYFRSRNPYKLKSYAAFGELYWNLTEAVKVTAGLRYTDDRKDFTLVPTQVVMLAGVNGAPGTVSRGHPEAGHIKQHWGEFSGRLGLDWQPDLPFTDHTMVYGFYSRGYKGGGANPPGVGYNEQYAAAAPRDYDPTFNPEFVDAFEIGAKNTLLAGGLILNGTAFYYDYKDYQVSQIKDRTAVNENFDAKVWGMELEAVFSPSPDLRMLANLGYLDTEIGDNQFSLDIMNRTQSNPDYVLTKPFPFFPSNCVVPTAVVEAWGLAGAGFLFTPLGSQWGFCTPGLPFLVFDAIKGGIYDPDNYPEINGGAGLFDNVGGNELPNSPHWTANIGAQYGFDLLEGWRATVRGDAYWQSQSWARVYNAVNDKLHGWYNVNLSLWLENDEGLKIELYAKNLLDKTPITDAFLNSDDTALTTNVFVLDPRLIGLSIRKEF